MSSLGTSTNYHTYHWIWIFCNVYQVCVEECPIKDSSAVCPIRECPLNQKRNFDMVKEASE